MRPSRCPNCAKANPPGALDCAGCGIVFEKWKPRQGRPAAAPAGAVTITASRAKAVGALAAAATAGLAALLWTVRPPAGEPLAKGAAIVEEYGFAFSPPEGWSVDRTVSESRGFRLVLTAQPADGGARVQVALGPERPLGIDLDNPGDVSDMLHEALRGAGVARVGAFAAGAAKVDRLRALRLEGSAEALTVRAETMESFTASAEDPWGRPLKPVKESLTVRRVEEEHRRFVVCAVPGGGLTYLVSVVADAGRFSRERDRIEAALASLRVLDRPYSGWHLLALVEAQVKDELFWGLLGLLVFGVLGLGRVLEPAEGAAGGPWLKRLTAGGFSCVAAFAAWELLSPPRGLAVPPGAFADRARGFALAASPGFVPRAGVELRGDTLLAYRAEHAKEPGLELVVLVSSSAPRALRAGKPPTAEFQDIVDALFYPPYARCSFRDAEPVVIDRLPGVRVRGTCESDTESIGAGVVQVAVGPSAWDPRRGWVRETRPELKRQVEISRARAEIIVDSVPGAGRHYFVGARAGEGVLGWRGKEVEESLAGLRVLERPLSAAHARRAALEYLRSEFLLVVIGLVWGLYHGLLKLLVA